MINGPIHSIALVEFYEDDFGHMYFRDGRLHRTDGPAFMAWDGYVEFWINGDRIDEPILDPAAGDD